MHFLDNRVTNLGFFFKNKAGMEEYFTFFFTANSIFPGNPTLTLNQRKQKIVVFTKFALAGIAEERQMEVIV